MPIRGRQCLMGEVEVKKLRGKAALRLICIIAAAVLAALLVPLAARAWWASKEDISSNTYGQGMHRYPALAAQGTNVYAMWSRQVAGTVGETNPHDPYYVQSSNNGEEWGTDTPIRESLDTDAYAPLDLTLDITGSVHFVWVEAEPPAPSETFTLYYSYTNASGVQTITQTTQTVRQPAIEVSSSDVHVVWAQGDVFPTNILYISKAIGMGAWPDSPTPVDSSSSQSYHPDMAVDDSDDLHVVWEEWDAVNQGTILYKKGTSGVWSTEPITLSAGIPDSHRPAIAVYSDTVNVVWCEKRIDDDQYVHFRQATDWGDNWSTASELIWGSPLAANQAFPTYLWPAITVDSNGKIHVAFNGGSDASSPEDIHYFSRPAGGKWSRHWNVTNNDKNATTPAVAAAGEYVHLIWAQQSSGTLYDVYYSRAGILEELSDVYFPFISKSY